MANQFLKLRRSAVPGRIPSTSSLDFGEIALNTYDGLAFIKKSGSAGEQVVTIGSTIGTGSFATTGSNTFYGNQIISGSLYITGSVLMSGSSFISGVDYIDFDTTASNAIAVARLKWNDADGTLDLGLKGGNVTLQIGQEEVVRVVNKSGVNLTEAGYQAVKILGAQGQRLSVTLAQGDNDANSQDTIGLVTEDILNNEEGFVTSNGLVRGINTTGNLQSETWAEGDQLYLSPITAGRITNIPPIAPQHTVRIGYVVNLNANNGSIFVKIDNGYELGELHNVVDNTTTSSYGDLLIKSGSVWNNSKQLTGSYGLTGSLQATSFTGSLFGTASWANNALTSSYILNAVSASFASTASSADNFLVRGTLTAQTIVAQVITASTEFVTGSTKFGSIVSNTHQFTGSVSVSGSLAVNGSSVILNNQTSSMSVLSASYASGSTSASFATQAANASTASYILNAVSSSYASSSTSASFASTASFVTTAQTASFVTTSQTASFVQNAQTASYILNAVSASYASSSTSASFATQAANAATASFVTTAQTASFVTTAQTASFVTTAQTASYVLQAVSASFATLAQTANTASYVLNAVSASYASTSTSASYALQATNASTASYVENAQTASYVLQAISASYASNTTSASFSSTASSADNFLVRGTLTAQTIVAQVITSSTDFVTGSTRFGSLSSNTHQFTGSVSISGSLTVPSFTSGSVLFAGANGLVNQDNANLFWNDTNNRLGIGTATPNAQLNVNQLAGSTKGILISGDEIYVSGNGATDKGVRIALGVSRTTNRQLWLGDNDAFGSSTLGIFRYNTGVAGYSSFDAVTGDGLTRLLLVASTETSNFGVGYDSGTVTTANYTGKLSVFVYNENRVSLLLRKTGTATGDFINAVDNTATTRFQTLVDGSTIIGGGASAGFRLDVSGSARVQNGLTVTGSLTVITGSNIEFQVTNTGVKIGNIITDAHTITGSLGISGSVTATNFTGSLFGTSSWANNATTASFLLGNIASASYAVSASFSSTSSLPLQGIVTASVANTTITFTKGDGSAFNVTISQSGSVATSSYSLYAETASYVQNAQTASFVLNAVSASYASSSTSASFASQAANATTASYVLNAISASFASTASSADNFLVRGTLTAQTIVAQTITSSTDFVTGSTRFGSLSSNTHQFTGSVSITGSLNITGTGITGSLFGTASWANNAISASYAPNSGVTQIVAGTNVTISPTSGTGSVTINATAGAAFPFTGSAVITGSLIITGSLTVITGSSIELQVTNTGVKIGNAITDTHTVTGSLSVSGSVTATNFTGSLLGTASFATNATSSSFAATASSADNFLVRGTLTAQTIVAQVITSSTDFVTGSTRFGSLSSNTHQFTGSVSITGSANVIGNTTITGSLAVSNSVSIGAFPIYPNTNTLGFNENNTQPGSSAQTAYHFTSGVSNKNIIFSFAKTFTNTAYFGNDGTNFYLANEKSTTGAFIFKKNLTFGGDLVSAGSNIMTLDNNTGNLFVSGAITGSSALINSASLQYQQNLAVATGSFQTIASVATGSYRCAFFDYVTFSGSTVRAGTVVSTWSGSATEYYENYTADLGGNTSIVTLQTAISASNIVLQAGISGSAWSVRSLVRLL